ACPPAGRCEWSCRAAHALLAGSEGARVPIPHYRAGRGGRSAPAGPGHVHARRYPGRRGVAMSGFGDYPFGDGPFGGIAPLPPGNRVGRRPVSWSGRPRIYRADITGTRLDDLTPPKATQVVAGYNDDTATKRSATFEVMYPDELRDLEDFVVVDLELTRDDGWSGVLPLGHYAVFGRSVTMDNTTRRGSLKGYDLTWLLHQATAPGSYVVSKGEDPGAAARTILQQQGIPASLINIPDA